MKQNQIYPAPIPFPPMTIVTLSELLLSYIHQVRLYYKILLNILSLLAGMDVLYQFFVSLIKILLYDRRNATNLALKQKIIYVKK